MSIIRMRLRLLCTYTFHVGVRREPRTYHIARLPQPRAFGFFSLARVQSRKAASRLQLNDLESANRGKRRAPRHHHRRRQQGVCPTRGHSAHREGPANWSSTMHRILSRLAGLACLLCVAVRFPTPAERAALVPDGWEPRRDARVSRQNQISPRSVAHPFPPASRPRPPHPRPPRSRACTSRNANSRPPWCPSARRTRAPGKMSSRWHPGF